MNNKVNILVNGKTPKHNIGDKWWIINFGEDGFTPGVKESYSCVDSISIGKFGFINYFNDFGHRITDSEFGYEGYFWTKEEAENWIVHNVPKNPSFTNKTDVFIVRGAKLDKVRIECMKYANRDFRYKIKDEDEFISEDDIGNCVFLTYEEAKVVRDKNEKALYI